MFLWSRIFMSRHLVLHFQVLYFQVFHRFWSPIFWSFIFSPPLSLAYLLSLLLATLDFRDWEPSKNVRNIGLPFITLQKHACVALLSRSGRRTSDQEVVSSIPGHAAAAQQLQASCSHPVASTPTLFDKGLYGVVKGTYLPLPFYASAVYAVVVCLSVCRHSTDLSVCPLHACIVSKRPN